MVHTESKRYSYQIHTIESNKHFEYVTIKSIVKLLVMTKEFSMFFCSASIVDGIEYDVVLNWYFVLRNSKQIPW